MSIWDSAEKVFADGEMRKDKARFIAHHGAQIAASMMSGRDSLLADTDCEAIAAQATKIAACVYDCAVKAAAQ